MDDLFLKLLNLSLSASVLAVVVMGLRLVLKKAPRWVNPVLWGIVGLRLLFPVSIESALSLLPSAEPIPADIAMAARPAIDSGIPAVNQVVNPILTETFAPDPVASANPLQILLEVGGWVWLAGVAAMLLYTLITYLRLRRRVSTAVPVGKGIYACETVASPFVLGLFRPKIYLPFGLSEDQTFYIVAHEKAHIRRRDHFWKPLGFLLLAVHWFNPVLWIAYILLCRDIELACDEKVVRSLGRAGRADYSEALLTCSVSRRSIAACPLAFGEVGVKERVKTVLNYKRPGFWMVAAAVTACVVFAVCFLTNPKTPTVKKGVYEPGEVIYTSIQSRTIKKLTEKPFQCRLTRNNRLEFKLLPAEDNLWQYRFQMEPYELTDEEFAKFTEKAEGWQGSPVGHITDAWRYTGDSDRFFLFTTSGGSFYLGLGVQLYPGGMGWMSYLAELNLVEEYEEEEVPEPTGMASDWGLSLSVGGGGPTGVDVYFWQDGSPLTGTLWCGNDYSLQKMEGKKWENLDQLQKPVWQEEDLPVADYTRHTIDWGAVYGALPSGTYRVGKNVRLRNDGIGEMQKTVYAEFTLNGPDSGAKPLTAEDVLYLTSLGKDLTWLDFEDYIYVEGPSMDYPTGPVGFHRYYDMGQHLELSIHGQALDYRPNNVCLECLECGSEFETNVILKFDETGEDTRKYIAAHNRPLEAGETNHLGIHFAVENPTSTKAEIILEGREFQVDTSSSHYGLWKQGEDGGWTSLAEKAGGSSITFGRHELDWGNRYGSLSPGNYRIYQDIDTEDGSSFGTRVRTEFTISDAAPDQEVQRPSIPTDVVQADLEFEGTTCLTVTDPARVQKVVSLFANAEPLGYEPKTHSIGSGTNLVLTAGDGEKITIELDIDSDLARLNGAFLFYGAFDEPNYIEKLWEYLGIEAWPEAVYEKYPNCFRG